jgi:N-methylhydantoinase A
MVPPVGAATCIGVDIGGTFTDVVLSDGSRTWRAKSPSTPHDVSEGVLAACKLVAEAHGTTLEGLLPTVDRFGLGTTAVTNTLASWTGQRLGLVTTAGFEDIVPLARGTRVCVDGWLVMPPSLVERERIVGLDERIDRDGAVIKPLATGAAQRAAEHLVESENVDAITVSFLWSFKNPDHEHRAVHEIRTRYPDLLVTSGVELQPAIREYERSTFALLNAYVGRSLNGVDALTGQLARLGLRVPLLLVHSGGGSMTTEEARRVPIRLAASGPAAGVTASSIVARTSDVTRAITCDVGGTSYDVALVLDATPERRTRGDVMGIWTSVPTVDVKSLGAGGGSLAWIDSRGLMRVGPRSAGATPGPVCYGRGGTEPTVTDALLVLGYLDPDHFLGGRMSLDLDGAHQACARLGEAIGMTGPECAWGIREIALAEMVKATRSMLSTRGLDARDFTLITYGGCGPLFTTGVARAIGAPRLLVPALASVLSAFGAAASDIRRERTLPLSVMLPCDPVVLDDAIAMLEAELTKELDGDAVEPVNRTIGYEVDVRFARQRWELTIPLESPVSAATVEQLARDFRAEYARRYGEGAVMAGAAVEVVALRGLGIGRTVQAAFERRDLVDPRSTPAPSGTRAVLLERTQPPTPVASYRMADLLPGHRVDGPALLDDVDTTIWVPPSATAHIDAFNSTVVELSA